MEALSTLCCALFQCSCLSAWSYDGLPNHVGHAAKSAAPFLGENGGAASSAAPGTDTNGTSLWVS